MLASLSPRSQTPHLSRRHRRELPSQASRYLRLWLLLYAAGLCHTVAVARADEPRGRLVILHDDAPTVGDALGIAVDGLLLQALARRTAFSSVQAAPISFTDLSLAADCGAQAVPSCLTQVGRTLDADWLLLRQLAQQADGEVTLGLTLYALHSGELRQASGQMPLERDHVAERVVPELVDRLLGIAPSRADAAVPTTLSDVSARDSRLTPTESPSASPAWQTFGGASALATGVGLLAGGFILRALASRDRHDYVQLQIETRDDVDRAELLLERSVDRSAAARALWASGASLGVLGAALLAWGRVRARRSAEAQVAVSATKAGLLLSLSGTFPGGL